MVLTGKVRAPQKMLMTEFLLLLQKIYSIIKKCLDYKQALFFS